MNPYSHLFAKQADPAADAARQNELKRQALTTILAGGAAGSLLGVGMGFAQNAMKPQLDPSDIAPGTASDSLGWRMPIRTQMLRPPAPAPKPATTPPKPDTPGNRLLDGTEEDVGLSPSHKMRAIGLSKSATGGAAKPVLRQIADAVPQAAVDMLPRVPTSSPVTSWWALPAAAGALGVGYLGANHLTNSAYSAAAEADKVDKLDQVRRQYRKALTNQYRAALGAPDKQASADPVIRELTVELDALCDAVEKRAEEPAPAQSWTSYLTGQQNSPKGLTASLPFGGEGTTLEETVNPLAGAYLAAALGTAALSGYGAYQYTKAQSPWQQVPVALRERAKRRQTPPVVEMQ